jgi:hypothetical protein
MLEMGMFRGVMPTFHRNRWATAAAAVAALTLGACLDSGDGEPTTRDDTAVASDDAAEVRLSHEDLLAMAREHVSAMRAAG